MKRYNTPRRRVIKTRLTEEEYAEFSERVTLCKCVPNISCLHSAMKPLSQVPWLMRTKYIMSLPVL